MERKRTDEQAERKLRSYYSSLCLELRIEACIVYDRTNYTSAS